MTKEIKCPGEKLEDILNILQEPSFENYEPGTDEIKELRKILKIETSDEKLRGIYAEEVRIYSDKSAFFLEMYKKYGSRDTAISMLSKHIKNHKPCMIIYLDYLKRYGDDFDKNYFSSLKQCDILNILNIK